jgi:hypothetical protein
MLASLFILKGVPQLNVIVSKVDLEEIVVVWAELMCLSV